MTQQYSAAYTLDTRLCFQIPNTPRANCHHCRATHNYITYDCRTIATDLPNATHIAHTMNILWVEYILEPLYSPQQHPKPPPPQ